jgi:hypothetical protein
VKVVFSKTGLVVALLGVVVAGLVLFGYVSYRARTGSGSSAMARRGANSGTGDHAFEVVPEPAASFQPSGSSASPRPEDVRKVQTLIEILKARNDNDPRLDTEFKALSPAAKRLFREQYRALAPEKRNERGTVVFLLGRNLTSPEDFTFLEGVLSEPPCLSMADCSQPAKGAGAESSHLEMGTEVSLAYPQLVALVSVEHLIDQAGSNGGSIAELDRVRETLSAGAKSPDSKVSAKARELQARLARLHR